MSLLETARLLYAGLSLPPDFHSLVLTRLRNAALLAEIRAEQPDAADHIEVRFTELAARHLAAERALLITSAALDSRRAADGN
jgi:hypothetical protein